MTELPWMAEARKHLGLKEIVGAKHNPIIQSWLKEMGGFPNAAKAWYTDDETRAAVWHKFASGPEPVGYDPSIIPMWKDGPTSEQFAVLRLAPYRLRVMPGTAMTEGKGEVLLWEAS